MDQISREGGSASGRTPAKCTENGADGKEVWRRGDARAKRGGSEGDGAVIQPGNKGRRRCRRQCKAKRRDSWREAAGEEPERGNEARKVGGCGSRMVRTRLLSRQCMHFSRGKAVGKRDAHLRGERRSRHQKRGAASAPLRNLGCCGSIVFPTVNSEMRVHCNCCRCGAEHTSRVGPAVAGDLPYSGGRK
jgi:hypothetical protein